MFKPNLWEQWEYNWRQADSDKKRLLAIGELLELDDDNKEAIIKNLTPYDINSFDMT